MKIIYIKWFDSSYQHETLTKEEVMQNNGMLILEDAGIYVGEDKKTVAYATQFNTEQNSYRFIHRIPKVNIIKRRFLKL